MHLEYLKWFTLSQMNLSKLFFFVIFEGQNKIFVQCNFQSNWVIICLVLNKCISNYDHRVTGGIIAGVVSDYTRGRATTCVVMLALGAPMVGILDTSHF